MQEEHIKEIFSVYGELTHVELVMDTRVNLPRGYAYVEFADKEAAEKARDYMDGGQIDGNHIT